MKKDNKDGWTKIGVIGVDAGLCWLGDPCYILHEKHTKDDEEPGEKPKAIGDCWLDFCDKIGAMKTHQQFNYDAGHPGLGVVVGTGYGDGVYDVYARITKDNRVAEVKVVFITPEDEK